MSHDDKKNTGPAEVDSGEDRQDEAIEIKIGDSEEKESDGPKTSESRDDSDEAEMKKESSEAEAEEAESESDRFLRLAAEFDNYKKRTAREFGEIIRTANARLLRSLVEIVDNFERALNHEIGADDGDAYRKGVELIYNQLTGLLEKESVSPIESVGKPFDPTYHEALMQADSDEYDDGIVCQEIQKGYKIDDKVLRHAKVVVSRGPSGGDKEENE